MTSPVQITLLHGNDEFAISEALGKACSGLGDPTTAAMNITRLDGRAGLDFEALNTAVNALPFLAPRRVLIFTNPSAAFPLPETKQRAESKQKFLELLEKAQPTTTIQLVEYEELDKKHWLLKWVAGAGGRATAHEYSMPKRNELPRWIEGEAKKQGGEIDRDAAALLADMVGEDTRVAAQEINKLLTYVNGKRAITMADVEKVSVVSAQGSIFDLVDALGMSNGRKAQHTLHRLLENENAEALFPMVIRQFRLLLQAREMLEARAGEGEIQRQLGLHPFVAQKVAGQARRFSLATLESIHHKLLEIDEADKAGRLPPEQRPVVPVPLEVALDALVVELTAPEE